MIMHFVKVISKSTKEVITKQKSPGEWAMHTALISFTVCSTATCSLLRVLLTPPTEWC